MGFEGEIWPCTKRLKYEVIDVETNNAFQRSCNCCVVCILSNAWISHLIQWTTSAANMTFLYLLYVLFIRTCKTYRYIKNQAERLCNRSCKEVYYF